MPRRRVRSFVCAAQVEAEKEAEALVEELKSKTNVPQIPIYALPRAMGIGYFV